MIANDGGLSRGAQSMHRDWGQCINVALRIHARVSCVTIAVLRMHSGAGRFCCLKQFEVANNIIQYDAITIIFTQRFSPHCPLMRHSMRIRPSRGPFSKRHTDRWSGGAAC